MARKTFQAANIELRHKTYFAVLYVPKDIQHIIGKTKFSRSTQTGDPNLAERRASSFVIGWRAEISRARHEEPDPIISEALDLLNNLRRKDIYSGTVEEIIETRIWEINKEGGSHNAKDFELIATGERKVLSALIPEWKIHETSRGLGKKTIDQMVCDVTLLTESFRTSNLLTSQYTSLWIRELALKANLTPSSVTRIIGFCKNFYRYLQTIEEVEKNRPDPFIIPNEYKKSKKANAKDTNKIRSWLPFDEDDVVSLYHEALRKKDQILADLIIIGAYTGARIEEICSLKSTEITLAKSCFNIVDAKTRAGIRTTPIHSKIKNRIASLISESKDGYLLSGLTFNKYGDRSNAIGKRFGRMKTDLKFGRSHVFHSIRKTLTTKLENSGVTENIAADIVGHEKPRITYGLYSGGASLEVMIKAIEGVSYNF